MVKLLNNQSKVEVGQSTNREGPQASEINVMIAVMNKFNAPQCEKNLYHTRPMTNDE